MDISGGESRFFVSYDLKDAESWQYEDLYQQLENLTPFCRLQESFWVVTFAGNSKQLLQHLAPWFSEDDSVFASIVSESDFLSHKPGGIPCLSDVFPSTKSIQIEFSWGSKLSPIN